jgi:CheY-like chemotaxis protein
MSQATTAGSGAQAFALAQVQPFDLILLDVMMPGMDGPTVFMRMRAMTKQPKCPVIFVTATALTREIAQVRE